MKCTYKYISNIHTKYSINNKDTKVMNKILYCELYYVYKMRERNNVMREFTGCLQ